MERILKTDSEISSLVKEQICNMFADWLEESMTSVMNSYSDLEWYEDCDFDDYFQELQEIYEENDEYIGKGLDFISFKVVVNEETKTILEELFESAREKAYDNKMCDFADAFWEDAKDYTPYDDDNPCSYDFNRWCEDGEMNSYFVDVDRGLKIYKIWEDSSKTNCINVIFDEGKIYRY